VIKDQTALQNLANAWRDVRSRQSFMQRHLLGSMGGIGSMPSIFLADPVYNLVLLYAYAVLDEVLRQLRDEGNFSSKTTKLGDLMHSSKTSLAWVNFDLVDKGREQRNDIAHCSVTIPRGECWKYIDAIEMELKSWQIVNP